VAQVVVEPVARLTDATTALVAASRGADLLVVGNRGRGALAGALLGSVAFSVTAAAHCPVVVVRGEASSALAPGPDRPVVLGVDGSPGAARALQFAASAAARAHAPLKVLAAWTPPEVADDGFAVIAHQELVEATQQTARDRAHEAVDAVRLLAPGVVVQDLVVQQPARRALAEASRGAGLVVVGARGHGALTGLFLGSVSHAVIHSAACPVAVVRAPHP
jgi:nucleotide-binding universal stress UspA family protein